MAADRQHAHHLLDQLEPGQFEAILKLLEVMIGAEEELTEEDRRAVAEADEWLKHNRPIPHEDVLADFGLSMGDWEKMGQEPLSEKTPRRNG